LVFAASKLIDLNYHTGFSAVSALRLNQSQCLLTVA